MSPLSPYLNLDPRYLVQAQGPARLAQAEGLAHPPPSPSNSNSSQELCSARGSPLRAVELKQLTEMFSQNLIRAPQRYVLSSQQP
ncbi:hypothetical protein Anapl_04300 [Anas platyrhynchos]|uniref:Uncharacterized protein n=1 Tax=Anas platyrhynchos TaxID=8839 RepID=R0KTD2_ANAPL|nr:hypothetical protein Anapl_04300 [Anas platyrhynchos]